MVTALDTPEGGDEEEGEIAAGDRGGETGSGDAEGWNVEGSPGVPKDEEPVAEEVDKVGSDEREGDGADVIEGLEVAAEGEVEEERRSAVVEGAQESDRAEEDLTVDGQAQHDRRGEDDDEDQCKRQADGEDKAVEQPAVRFLKVSGAVGLGEVGVEAEEDAGDAEGDGVVEDLAEG